MLLDHGGAENWRWISAFKDIMVKIRGVDGLHKEFIVLHFYQAPTSKGIDSLVNCEFGPELEQSLEGLEKTQIKKVRNSYNSTPKMLKRNCPLVSRVSKSTVYLKLTQPDHVSKEVLELTQQHKITSSQHAGIILNLETGTKLNGLDELMADQKLEIIMTPLDRRPYGMVMIASPGSEGEMLQEMNAWEATVATWLHQLQIHKI
ncbi:uncharacterized protein RAG0_11712 [Rhynchosporium agropyri]|uniref:Uncharacterized protein n=1 Tax=Rhynchosporium agropyri TaxID=914238 RepID=A0A1E1L5P1_9HELO|nr:uncharacterized protein RAG0_11712 [Rhynchosporium agropyri]